MGHSPQFEEHLSRKSSQGHKSDGRLGTQTSWALGLPHALQFPSAPGTFRLLSSASYPISLSCSGQVSNLTPELLLASWLADGLNISSLSSSPLDLLRDPNQTKPVLAHRGGCLE